MQLSARAIRPRRAFGSDHQEEGEPRIAVKANRSQTLSRLIVATERVRIYRETSAHQKQSVWVHYEGDKG